MTADSILMELVYGHGMSERSADITDFEILAARAISRRLVVAGGATFGLSAFVNPSLGVANADKTTSRLSFEAVPVSSLDTDRRQYLRSRRLYPHGQQSDVGRRSRQR